MKKDNKEEQEKLFIKWATKEKIDTSTPPLLAKVVNQFIPVELVYTPRHGEVKPDWTVGVGTPISRDCIYVFNISPKNSKSPISSEFIGWATHELAISKGRYYEAGSIKIPDNVEKAFTRKYNCYEIQIKDLYPMKDLKKLSPLLERLKASVGEARTLRVDPYQKDLKERVLPSLNGNEYRVLLKRIVDILEEDLPGRYLCPSVVKLMDAYTRARILLEQ